MTQPPKAQQNARPSPACPVCGKPAAPAHTPFCSAICRDRDLIAWLDGRHVIPGRDFGGDSEDG